MPAAPEYFCRKMFFRMFWTSGISGFALALSNVIDSVCVGNDLGSVGLAAIGIVNPIYILYNVAGYGFSVGGSVTFSKFMSEGNEKKAIEHFNGMLEIAVIFSVIFAAVGNIFIKPVVTLLGAANMSAVLFELCHDYIRILLIAFPVFMLNFIFNDFLRSDNDQYLATVAFVTGCILDFFLNILFVAVFKRGVIGSAYATVIAQFVSVAISMLHFFDRKNVLSFKAVKPDLALCLRSVMIGVSTSVESLFMFFFILISNKILMNSKNADGEIYTAVFDVIMNISYITKSMFLSAGETLRPLAGTFYAEYNYGFSKYALKLSLKWGYILNIFVIAAIFIFAEKFAVIFGINDPESISLASHAIRIFCPGALLSGAGMIISFYFQSTEREKYAMIITTLRSFVILIGISLILCRLNIALFWYAMPATEIITLTIIALAHFIRKSPHDDGCFMSYMLCSPEDIGTALEKTETFCNEYGMSIKQTNMLVMFIEEICSAIINHAFCGKQEEYIQITVAVEGSGGYILHVRDSAVTFNPFDMKTRKFGGVDDDEEFLDSMGVLMMKNKAKDFHYRRYQGFNMLTVKF